MTKSAKRSIIISAILAIIMCASLIAGATLAIFTSESKVNIAVTSGKVDVVATISDGLTLEHKEYNSTTDSYDTKEGFWGGSATLDEKAQTLTINNMVPMDKISFSINVKNESSVGVKYRTVIMCEADNGLFEALTVTINSQSYEGRTSVGAWTTLAVGSALETVPVTIEMPEEKENKYQNKTCTISYKVEAVQGNAKTTDLEENVYELYNALDLKWFQKHASEVKKIDGKVATVKLMESIDLNGAEWAPINWTVNDGSVFDGQNYTISNFIVKANSSAHDNSLKDLGLFGGTTGITIKNLKIDSATVSGVNHVGAIVGHALCTKIEGCTVTNSNITAYTWWDPTENNGQGGYNDGDKVGAIAGYLSAEPDAWVKGCRVESCTLKGYRDVGSLVGYAGTGNNSGSWEISGNTVGVTATNEAAPVTIINDRTTNYKAYATDVEFDVNNLIGEKAGHANATNNENNNTCQNVTTQVIPPVYNVTTANVQDCLDGKLGILTNATLVLAAGDYGKLELGRATAYAGSNTVYYNTAEGFSGTPVTLAQLQRSHAYRYYMRSMNNVTIKAAEGATVTIAGLEMVSGHITGATGSPSEDYVIGDSTESSNGSYYLAHQVTNLSFENLNFTAQCNIASSQNETTINGVTFTGCTFTTGGTAAANGAAVRYYNEKDSSLTNLTVDDCTFTNCYQGVLTSRVKGIMVNNCGFDGTGHNAIAIQRFTGTEAFNHGLVVITNNNFTNIGNRIIRFADVGADTQIIIKNNTASNYDTSAGETMKAESLADGITYEIKKNSWAAEGVANEQLRDQD